MNEFDNLEGRLREHGPRPGAGVRPAVMARFNSRRHGIFSRRVPLYAAVAAVALGMLFSALGTWNFAVQSSQAQATRAWVEYMDSLSARNIRLMQASEHFPSASY